MRKIYSKPTIQMESFEMDIDIMAMTKAELEAWRFAFETVYGKLPDTPETQQKFDEFLASNGYDNSTSGFCYFSPVQPS